MKKEIPLTITFITGFIIILGFFIPREPFGGIQSRFLQWYAIIVGFTMVIGLISLARVHTIKIMHKIPGYGYSFVLIISMIITLIVCFYSGFKYGDLFKINTPFMWYYSNIFTPLSATMFSLLAFFIASAAYRAFRARTLDATLFLLAGIFIMFGRVPISEMVYRKSPIIVEWIMNIPQMAAKRGIFIGIAVGMIITSLRIIFGIERSYLR